MNRFLIITLAFNATIACLASGCGERTQPPVDRNLTASFDGDSVNHVPLTWRIATTNPVGNDARWEVRRSTESPANQIFSMLHSENYDGTFNLAISDKPQFEDLELTVKVRADGGNEDQGGGPVWRCRDQSNYYVCRFNPLEDNFRVYVVAEGHRRQLGSVTVETQSGRWYTVTVKMIGTEIECSLDGDSKLVASDSTFQTGGIGLWTKADATTSFDDLEVKVAKPAEAPSANSPPAKRIDD